MKAWEEKWRLDGFDLERDDGLSIYETSSCGDGREAMAARAKLAAAAPRMARMLLWYEWRFNVNGCTPEGGCPACMESRLSGHAEDCPYVKLMADAGVDGFHVQKKRVFSPSGDFLQRLREKNDGKAENRRLHEENAALRAELEQHKRGRLARTVDRVIAALAEDDPPDSR